MSGLLAEILAGKVEEARELARRALPNPPALRPVPRARARGALDLWAEHKRRSPSGGVFPTHVPFEARMTAYQRGGASVVSILTDHRWFGGSFDDLRAARLACDLPLLCKDFVVDEAQLDAARAHGADLVLLIVRCLEEARLPALVRAARERGLEPVVEVVTLEELRRAVEAGATTLGANARDLDTLAIDAARADAVLSAMPPGVTALHFSSIASPEQVRALRGGRADGVLVGEALMRAPDPGELLLSLRAAASDALGAP